MLDVVVLDIDNTILDTEFLFREIHNLQLKGDEMWNYFCKNCNSEKVSLMPNAFELTRFITSFSNAYIVFSTARNEKCRQQTLEKLWSYGISFLELYMRPDGDLRPSAEIKREHLIDIMNKYIVNLFIDDDLSNCKMAKELGILALRKV